MTAKPGTFAVTTLLCSLTAAIALLPMTGVTFGQENNFTLSSPAFADNGTMAQKYMGKNPANPNCIGENISPPCNGAMPLRLRGATRSSCTIRRGETV